MIESNNLKIILLWPLQFFWSRSGGTPNQNIIVIVYNDSCIIHFDPITCDSFLRY